MMKKKEFKEYYSSLYDEKDVPITEMTGPVLEGLLSSDKIRPPLPYIISDPSLCDKILERNGQNRKIKTNHVRDLYVCMSEGIFRYETPNSIVIDKEGRLIDGGHRLSAAKRYLTNNPGACVLFSIGSGYPPETANSLDRGKKRQLREIVKIASRNDVEFSHYQQTVINAYFFTMPETKNQQVQGEAAQDFYEKYKEIIDRVCSIFESSEVAKSLNVNPYVVASFINAMKDCSVSTYNKINRFMMDALTVHISKFPEFSPRERFVRMLQDSFVMSKVCVKSGTQRQDLFLSTSDLIRLHLDGQDKKDIVMIRNMPSDFRETFEDAFEEHLEEYNTLLGD